MKRLLAALALALLLSSGSDGWHYVTVFDCSHTGTFNGVRMPLCEAWQQVQA